MEMTEAEKQIAEFEAKYAEMTKPYRLKIGGAYVHGMLHRDGYVISEIRFCPQHFEDKNKPPKIYENRDRKFWDPILKLSGFENYEWEPVEND